MKKIGIIGSGRFASTLVGKLIDAGQFVVTLNNIEKTNKNVENIASNNPVDIANICAIIFTVVEDSVLLEEVLVGKQGVLNSSRSNNIVIDMSPVSPEFIQEIAEKFIESERFFLDAAYVDSTEDITNAQEMILVGGEKSIYNKVCPILRLLVESVEYIGGYGASQFHRQAFAVRSTKNNKQQKSP